MVWMQLIRRIVVRQSRRKLNHSFLKLLLSFYMGNNLHYRRYIIVRSDLWDMWNREDGGHRDAYSSLHVGGSSG